MAEPVAANAADEAQQAAAWKQVQPGDSSIAPPPTGDSLGHANDEKARIRAMLAGDPSKIDVDPSKAFRDPNARAERAAIANQPNAEPGVNPPAPERAERPEQRTEPAPAAPPADGLDPELERRILGSVEPDQDTRIFDDSTDTKLKIGEKEVSAARLREMEDAYLRRAELDRRQQELEQRDQVMRGAVREFKRDPLGSLSQIGVTPDVVAEQLRARGLYAGEVKKDEINAPLPELPAEHTPLEAALFKQNQALVATVRGLKTEVDGVKDGIRTESEQRREAQLRHVRSASIEGANSFLRSSAAVMPAMVDSPGKLSPMAKLLLQNVELRLEQQVPLGASPEQVRAMAIREFAQAARTAGIASKEQRAQAALGSRRAPVPTRSGTTVPLAEPGANGNGRRFDFQDDEQRMNAAAQWFAAEAQGS